MASPNPSAIGICFLLYTPNTNKGCLNNYSMAAKRKIQNRKSKIVNNIVSLCKF